MNIKELVRGIENCECGKSHFCPIDYVEIGNGATKVLPEICKEYNNILLVSDNNTYKVCGADVKTLLGDKIENSVVMADNGDVVIPNEEKIAEIEGYVTDKTDLIIGVGSGVINDLCKYVSHKHDLYYYIVATAPSMDGYASVGSALILEGMKITLNARPPKAIIADTAVLKDAPMDMIRAGYGDIVGKYSCLNDWKLSAFINGEYFCKTVYDLTYSCAKQVETLADGINSRDEKTVGVLMEALVAVGIAMAYVGNSRPASGSEHHLSHYYEITCILEKREYLAHGIDVAFSAIATAALREKMLGMTPKKIAFDRADWEKNIRRVYHSSADGVIALQDKLGWYNNDDSAIVEGKWEEIKKILSEVPTEAEFKAMVERVGLVYADFEKLYGAEKIADSILYSKDLKDRYTVLWLYYNYFRA